MSVVKGFSLHAGISNDLSKKERRAVAKEIRRYRHSSGHTLRSLAHLAGVTYTTISSWESARSMVCIGRACELHRKTNGACRVEMMRPDFIKFLREFKDVIDDLKI